TSGATADGGIALYLIQPDIDPGFSPSIVRRFAPDGSSVDQPGFGSINPASYDVGRYLATGQLIELETALSGAPVRTLIASAQDATGDAYLLVRTRTAQQLEKLGPGGSVAWSVAIDDAKNSPNGSLRVSGGRACAYSWWS